MGVRVELRFEFVDDFVFVILVCLCFCGTLIVLDPLRDPTLGWLVLLLLVVVVLRVLLLPLNPLPACLLVCVLP